MRAAAERCTRQIDRIALAEGKLREGISSACGRSPLGLDDLLSESGLGFGAIMSCAAAGTPADIATCIAQQHSCEADRLFHLQEPRARDLMELASVPTDRLERLGCLASGSGDTEGVGSSGAGKKLVECQSAITRAGARLARAELIGLGQCSAWALRCDQTRRGDERCYGQATKACVRAFEKMVAQRNDFGPSIEAKCAQPIIDYELLRQPEAADLDVLMPECERYGVPNIANLANYVLCVRRQHQCGVEALRRFEAPRAEALIERLPLELPSQFPGPFCP